MIFVKRVYIPDKVPCEILGQHPPYYHQCPLSVDSSHQTVH